MNEADLIIEQAKKEAEEIINIAFCDAEKIIDNAKDEAKKIIEEADYLLKEYEHIHKDRSRILSTLQSLEESSYIEDDWQLKCTQDYLKRINKSNELHSYRELITDWEIKGDIFFQDSSLRKLLSFSTLYCDSLINKIAMNAYKKGLANTIMEAYKAICTVESLIPWEFEYKISEKYIERKRKQIELVYEIEEYKARKKEEQRLLKEQQREEAAAQREFERELKKAQKDQQKAEEALQLAKEKAEKEKENAEAFAKYQEQIASLQAALEEAQQRSERVMSMAQQTRQGWVYIISNIGSFGENVYKIGMTRRLDPMERVNELGDASVPFPFDVHAMIFSEDAPALETALHQAFESQKTNLVNGKKEFFNVPLCAIKDKVKELGYEVEFEETPTAPQYRDTLFARKID